MDPTNLQIATTSSSSVGQQVALLQGPKRKFTATRKRQTRRRIVPDEDNCPEFCVEDAEGQTRVQDEPDGPEFHMKDVDDPTSVQDDAEGPAWHRAGARNADTS